MGVLKIETSASSSPLVIDKEAKSTVGGGVENVYGEDSPIEDTQITLWNVTVAR